MGTRKILSVRQEGFCQDYAIHGDPSKAFIDNYNPPRTDKKYVAKRVWNLTANPRIQRRVQYFRDRAAQHVEFKIVDVLHHWVAIATADPAELIQYRRICCRYCYGKEHKYQWTESEYADECADYLSRGKKPPEAPGGLGFNATIEPHPQCPSCFGQGTETIFITDTRKLTGKAKLLYAGVRQKSGGIEILMRDQDKALENIARYLGMFKEKEDNHPTKSLDDVKLPADPIEAAKIYQKFIS